MSRVDAVSLTLWSVGMLALVYAIVAFAGGWGEVPEIAAALGILCLLWAVSRLARDTTHLHLPHVPFRIVGVTLFTGGVLGLVQSGSLLQLSSFLKGVQGYSDLESGLALAPFVVATFVASMATGVLLTRRYRAAAIDLAAFRRPVVLGLGLVAAALLLLSTLVVDSAYLPIGVTGPRRWAMDRPRSERRCPSGAGTRDPRSRPRGVRDAEPLGDCDGAAQALVGPELRSGDERGIAGPRFAPAELWPGPYAPEEGGRPRPIRLRRVGSEVSQRVP